MAPARPRHVALLAVALLVAACGGGDDDAGGQVPSSVTGTTAVGGPASSAPGGASPTSAPPPSTATTGGPAGTIGPVDGGGDDGGAPPPVLDADVAVGQFAPALLRSDLSERLVIEVHADIEPRSGTVAHVADVLADVSGKPVSTVAAGAPGGGDRDWTGAELRQAADAGSTTAQGGGVAVVRLLFVNGTFEGDDSVLGVAVRGDVAAVFVDRTEAAGGLLGGSAAIEAAVTAHELGHLLGLVDLVLDTGREDPDHPGHSPNQGSVMYWAVESDLIGQVLGADPPDEFDAADLADLAAIRGS
jgi:hypothetical protein